MLVKLLEKARRPYTVVPLYNAVFGMKNFAYKIRVVQGDCVIQGIL